MKKAIILFILLLSNKTNANELNDYGNLLAYNKFSEHCNVTDIGLSGGPTIQIYAHGQVGCDKLQKLYTDTYAHIYKFLGFNNYDLTQTIGPKNIVLHILTLAELNNPENFSQTDKRCMYDIKCDSGAFFGRTFYSDHSSNINVYVVYPEQHPPSWKYSFESSIKHELMHVILYRYRLNRFMSDNSEHKLIDKFLIWDKSR